MPAPTADRGAPHAGVPLDWGYDSSEVSAGGLEIKRTGTEAERAALAAALDIVSCEALHVVYRLKRAPAEGYLLSGKVTADVVQACVVTLAPVYDSLSLPFDVEFRPEDEVNAKEGGSVDLDEEIEIEPIEGTWLAVGRIVFEEIAAGLNPYPRRPGAEFKPTDAGADEAKPNPFAVLAKLKSPPPETK